MIPLGSCTMKLNAAAEMMPVTWPTVANLHPFAPTAHSAGYRAMTDDLERWLAEITGFDAVSLQPNAGSQGEYAGPAGDPPLSPVARRVASHRLPDPLLRPRHQSGQRRDGRHARRRGRAARRRGDIDMDDLRAKVAEHAANLAALMFTYPSTHGVFEEGASDICSLVHEAWRPGLFRRRQPQRAGRPGAAGRHRRRRLPHEPAQDLLHPAWRRRSRRRDRSASRPISRRSCPAMWHRAAAMRWRRRRSAARRSCRSPGCTSA